ncbi:MAG: hypothetical protein C4570_03780, partial [Ammonifex sp.]
VFDPAAGTWSLVADHRGQTYYDPASGEASTCALGVEPPEGWPDTPPPAGMVGPTWDGAQWVGNLALAKEQKQAALLDTVQRFIQYKPDGRIRYDGDLKMNLINAALVATMQQQAPPAAYVSVSQWIAAVQAEYFTLKAAVAAAADEAALAAVDISSERLEGLYGVEGTSLPDPDKSTADLIGPQ